MNNANKAKEEKLLRAFGFIDEKYIEEASPEHDEYPQAVWAATAAVPAAGKMKPHTRIILLRIAAVAAAIAIVIANTLVMLKPSEHIPDVSSGITHNLSFTLTDNTSGIYKTIPELAAYLKQYGDPNAKTAGAYDGKITSSVDMESPVFKMLGITTGRNLIADRSGKYVYKAENGFVSITKAAGGNQPAGKLEVPADSLFVTGDSLIVVSQSKASEEGSDTVSTVRIYDISSPGKPKLRDEFVQVGEIAACWLRGDDEFYLITNGMGKLSSDAVRDYYPSLTHNGEAVTWDDNDVSILGEPVTLQYSALSVINAHSGTVQRKQALYGNIQKLFCGEDWFAAAVAAETSVFRENPVLYTFDEIMDFTGSISLAEINGAPGKNSVKNGTELEGDYLSIVSVEKYGDLFRMVGTRVVRWDGGNDEFFMAVAAGIKTGRADLKLISADDYPDGLDTQILWLDDKVTIFINGVDDHIDIPFYELGGTGTADAVSDTDSTGTESTTVSDSDGAATTAETTTTTAATTRPRTTAATTKPKTTTTTTMKTTTTTTSSTPSIPDPTSAPEPSPTIPPTSPSVSMAINILQELGG